MKAFYLFLISFLMISSCGESTIGPESNPYYDGMDCGNTEQRLANYTPYALPYSVVFDPGLGQDIILAAQKAEDRWNNAVGDVVLTEDPGNAQVYIFQTEGSGDAITTFICNGDTPCVGYIHLGESSQFIAETTLLHEFGHVLGLGHTGGEDATHSNREQIQAQLDECSKHSIMSNLGGYITVDSIRIIKDLFKI